MMGYSIWIKYRRFIIVIEERENGSYNNEMWFNYKNLIDFKIYVVKINYWGE